MLKKKTSGKFQEKVVKGKSSSRISQEQLEQFIRERAYYIWEEWGKPEGRDFDIWTQADREIRAKYSVK